MSDFQPAPKFKKKLHHVVPRAWQRKFAAPNDPGPFYKNVLTGQCRPAEGPGDKMAEPYANIVFDEYYRPSDKLEDDLSQREATALSSIDRIVAASAMDRTARVDMAYLLAMQTCRYPEEFASRLNLGRYLAIALKDFAQVPDVATLNRHLRAQGLHPGTDFTKDDFLRLSSASPHQLEAELNLILTARDYEHFYNPDLIMKAANPVAEHLLGLEWQLLKSPQPAFLLSDRPTPIKFDSDFSLGLSATMGVRVRYPTSPVGDGEIAAIAAPSGDIQAVNQEVRGRAREWICGPGVWVHGM